jgi:hypothetical protein
LKEKGLPAFYFQTLKGSHKFGFKREKTKPPT